jgi:iron complex transport system ATP-binding protein
MAVSSSVFKMNHVSVTRGERDILRNINWEVREGEHWALIGGNGSGKTSLLKVLLGYLTPTTGEIAMPGRQAAIDSIDQDWDAWRKKIGFVSSSIAELIEPTESALDVVMAGRHAMVNYWQRDNSVMETDRKAAEKILKKINCRHLAYEPWAYLSQGERQRLLIGRALMAPGLEVLILDEPCAGLDPMAREHFLHFIQGMTAKGNFKSLIMVTHHVEEIFPDITHAMVIRDGTAIASGEKKEALTSRTVSLAFGGDLKLRSREARYRIYFDDEEMLPGFVV